MDGWRGRILCLAGVAVHGRGWRYSGLLMLMVVALLLATAAPGVARTVTLPLTLDFKLLTALLVREAFPDKNQSAAIVGRPGECTYLGISEPKFSSAGNYVRLDMRLTIRLGTDLAGECLVPVEWQGYLTLVQQPVFDGRSFSLAFRTVDSTLTTLSRQPATVAGVLWEFAKPRVTEYLNRERFDLAPPVRDMREFLAPLFHPEVRQASQAMLDSLRGGRLTVTREGLEVELHSEVEEVFPAEPARTTIDAAERKRLIRVWETWDVFLVRLVSLIASEPLTPEDQRLLADVLLDTRYAFAATLEAPDLEKDFVRLQFLRAWHTLAPLFRRQLYAKASANTLGYLAFFTAADALQVLDQMGPILGIEISEQGLLQLVAMITGRETTLPYGLEIDPKLRQLLQLPPLEASPPGEPEEEILEIDLPPEPEEVDPFSRIGDFFSSRAYAAEMPPAAELLEWRVPTGDFDDYLQRVRTVVAEAAIPVLAKEPLSEPLQEMFRTMVVAIAWQESCFRQFIEKNKKLTFVLSSNQTSVGLMQINERVWRGIYDRNRLRWDIRYNARAGCEIADLYLRRHALPNKAAAKIGQVPGMVYAMYSGGPGQLDNFLARHKGGKLLPSDQGFAEKWTWTQTRDWEQLSKCLGGG
jgi:hypothetical protein